MRQYFNEIDYQPDNSRILDYYTQSRSLYQDPIIVSFVINEQIEYWNNSEFRNLENIYRQLTSEDFCYQEINRRMEPWFINLKKSLQEIRGKRRFRRKVEQLQMFYIGTPYQNNWVLSEDYDVLKTRFFIALKPVAEKDLARTREIIETIHAITSGYEHELYFTSRDLMLWERNSHMRQSIWITILIALSSCIAVTLVLLPHPVVFLSVSLCAAFTMVSTLGFMALYGIEYSLCSYIIVLLMIGLCIDYISHVGHAYIVDMCENRFTTTKHALENIGVPLFNAAMSSVISISMLGFSHSNMMRRIFVSMVLLFGFSFFYGVIFLPIILSIIGPTRRSSFKLTSTATNDCNVNSRSPTYAKYVTSNISQKVFAGKTQREPLILEATEPEKEGRVAETNGVAETTWESPSNVSAEKETGSSIETDSNV